jgi:hypothetical protein
MRPRICNEDNMMRMKLGADSGLVDSVQRDIREAGRSRRRRSWIMPEGDLEDLRGTRCSASIHESSAIEGTRSNE